MGAGRYRPVKRQPTTLQTLTYAPDFNSYTYKAEIAMDGKTWVLANEGKGTRVKAAK
jgi:hypothetical protein